MALIDKLTAIADAIRKRDGITDKLTLDQIAKAASERRNTLDEYLNGTLKEVYSSCTNLPWAEYGFANCEGIVSANLPNVCEITSSTFEYCEYLANVNIPSAKYISYYAFSNCYALEFIDLPSVVEISDCAFSYCRGLKTVLLRSEKMCELEDTTAFEECNDELRFYVPSALIDSYKSATNWSEYADRFRALEDYTVDGTTTGEFDMSKI